MAFDDSVFIKMIEEDTFLIKALKKHKSELKYAKGRIATLTELREELAEAVEKQSAKKAAKVAERRTKYVSQTRFLLLADYVHDLKKIEEFFPPPEDSGGE